MRRAALIVAAVVVALNLMAVAIEALVPSPSGPASSSYATSGPGVAAYAALLERNAKDVSRVRAGIDNATLDPGATVVLLEPDILVGSEIEALEGFVEAGGRLVFAAREPDALLEGLFGADAPDFTADGPRRWTGVTSAPESGAAGEVLSAGRGSFSDPGAARPVVSARGGDALVVSKEIGAGEAVLLADASPLQNRLLARGDNAALGLGLVGDRRASVAFVEAVHGYGQGRGLGALPGSWKLALAGVGLGVLLFLLSHARRLGPPDPPAPAPPPSRGAYVDALGEILHRTGDSAAATEVLRANARELLAERHGPAAAADPEAVRRSALRAGMTPDEAEALAGEGGGETVLLAAGKGLGRLREHAGGSGRPR